MKRRKKNGNASRDAAYFANVHTRDCDRKINLIQTFYTIKTMQKNRF